MSEMLSSLHCRPACIEDMKTCAEIVNHWIDETPWMPRIHDHTDVERHYRDTVYAQRDVIIVECDGTVAGFVSLSTDHYIIALFIGEPARGRGCGNALLDRAKDKHPLGLKLWTFQANIGAQRFYAREGFHETCRTDGDNEERLPDILFEWRPGS